MTDPHDASCPETPLGRLVCDRMRVLGIDSKRELGRVCDIDKSVVTLIFREGGTVTEATLQKLAVGLRLSVRRLRVAAGFPAGEDEPYEPTWHAHQLDASDRRLLDLLAQSLHAKATVRTTDMPKDDWGVPD